MSDERRLSMNLHSLPSLLMGLALGVSGAAFGIVHAAKSPSNPGPSDPTVSAVEKGEGIVTKPSNHSVDKTVARLKAALQTKGIKLFVLVDHSGEAAKAGLKMPNTKLLIFGNPKGGTPLMLASPSIAIDLPLKILVAEDAQGKVWISYNSPEYLIERHGLPPDLVQNIAVVETLAAQAAE
jgi:uncharacterized protein (DUF302 family)